MVTGTVVRSWVHDDGEGDARYIAVRIEGEPEYVVAHPTSKRIDPSDPKSEKIPCTAEEMRRGLIHTLEITRLLHGLPHEPVRLAEDWIV